MTSGAAAGAPRRRLDPRVVVGVVYVGSMLMSSIDITIVNVAIPKLAEGFGVSAASAEWVVVGYLVSLAMWIPASGWFGDRFGNKRVFLTAVAVFSVASALCGVAQSVNQLVAFRLLQGVGGGMLTPVGMAMLWRTFPPEERARAARILIIPGIVGPASGPLLGGYLVDHFSWRWVFYVNIPVGAAIFLFGVFFLHEHREPNPGGFDVGGFLLAGPGLAALLYALGEGPGRGWASPYVLVPGAIAAVMLVALVKVELGQPEPMLQLRLLNDRLFRTMNISALFGFGAFLGFLFLVPIFLQNVRGASAFSSGATTFPEAVGVLCSTQLLVARLYPRIGPRRLMMFGYTGIATLVMVMSFVTLETNTWVIRLIMFATGFTMAFSFLSLQAGTFARIEPAMMGRASAIYNAQRQSASAMGVAILATVLKALMPADGSPAGDQLHAFQMTFRVCAVLALLGAVVAYFVHDEDAASTMVRKGKAAPADAAASPASAGH
ncbi:MAG: MDR family MFS transporter [Acidimicrobiia bacterium]